MIMSWIWTILVAISILCALFGGTGQLLSSAVLEGAQSGATLSIAMAGSLCLWSGVAKLMDAGGVTGIMSRILMPLLRRVFPSSKSDPKLAGALSGNICANFLGLGNAATPMGIRAVQQMKTSGTVTATDEMCRLIVLNTASIQLIPGNVAAVRSALGAAAPFDILPAVWITSLCSAGLGLAAAWLLGRLCRHD